MKGVGVPISCFVRAWETCCPEPDVVNLAIESAGEVMLEEGVDVKLEKSDSAARAPKSRFRDVGRLGGSMYGSDLRGRCVKRGFQHERSGVSRVARYRVQGLCELGSASKSLTVKETHQEQSVWSSRDLVLVRHLTALPRRNKPASKGHTE